VPRQVYLDSCIVIYLVQGPDPVRDAVLQALRPTDQPAPQAWFSALTRLECRTWPIRERALDLLAQFDDFFASRDLRRTRLTVAVFDLATELRAAYGIKTPDAIHLVAAIHWGCDEFWTNDRRIPKALETRIEIRALP
jgi:uncharacterized protein